VWRWRSHLNFIQAKNYIFSLHTQRACRSCLTKPVHVSRNPSRRVPLCTNISARTALITRQDMEDPAYQSDSSIDSQETIYLGEDAVAASPDSRRPITPVEILWESDLCFQVNHLRPVEMYPWHVTAQIKPPLWDFGIARIYYYSLRQVYTRKQYCMNCVEDIIENDGAVTLHSFTMETNFIDFEIGDIYTCCECNMYTIIGIEDASYYTYSNTHFYDWKKMYNHKWMLMSQFDFDFEN
jgi:hypothetical protein